MNNHEKINQLLPFYSNQQLEENQIQEVETHLKTCAICQEDLKLWQDIEQSIHVENQHDTPSLSPQVFAHITTKINTQNSIQEKTIQFIQLFKAQFKLIKKEIWQASFLILFIGFMITILIESEPFFYAIAPLVSAASLSILYNRQNDPAFELTLSTPVSQMQILLIRLFIVFSYNLALVFLYSASLSLIYSAKIITPLLYGWLAPMTFLSILAMTISIILNSEYAIFISYSVWLSKYIFNIAEINHLFSDLSQIIKHFWDSPQLIFSAAAIFLIIFLVFAKKGLGKKLSVSQTIAF